MRTQLIASFGSRLTRYDSKFLEESDDRRGDRTYIFTIPQNCNGFARTCVAGGCESIPAVPESEISNGFEMVWKIPLPTIPT